MTYAEAVAHLYSLAQELAPTADGARRKFDLAHMRRLCAELGDPQKVVPAVLVGGTNGKGSTAATLASILNAAGYRTGLYTSPHLSRVNERIQLSRPSLPSEYGSASAHGSDGALQLTSISDDTFARLYTVVDAACERLMEAGELPVAPSFFERLTALAFLYYAGWEGDCAAEIVVLEVGLGGRLDATNVVEPLFAVITDIALDHQDYLGDTIAEITREKCGILRKNGTLITLPQLPQANEVIGTVAMELGVRGVSAAEMLPNQLGRPEPGLLRNHYTLQLPTGPLEIDSPLAGHHQQRNLALAIAAALELRGRCEIPDSAIELGICNTFWPGRLERIAPNLLLDVAHNPAGAWTLRAAIANLPPQQPRTLIFSCLRDKNLTEMSRILFPLFDSAPGCEPDRSRDHIILAAISSSRAALVEDLLAAAHAMGVRAHAAPHLAGALAQARQITPPDGLIIATGSVYLVGELRELALQPVESHA